MGPTPRKLAISGWCQGCWVGGENQRKWLHGGGLWLGEGSGHSPVRTEKVVAGGDAGTQVLAHPPKGRAILSQAVGSECVGPVVPVTCSGSGGPGCLVGALPGRYTVICPGLGPSTPRLAGPAGVSWGCPRPGLLRWWGRDAAATQTHGASSSEVWAVGWAVVMRSVSGLPAPWLGKVSRAGGAWCSRMRPCGPVPASLSLEWRGCGLQLDCVRELGDCPWGGLLGRLVARAELPACVHVRVASGWQGVLRT